LKHEDDDGCEMTGAEIKELSAPESCSEEKIDWDDPIVEVNYRKILRKVLQESGSSWRARKFLEVSKQKAAGFDYRVVTNELQ
jgi:hypothetical protein